MEAIHRSAVQGATHKGERIKHDDKSDQFLCCQQMPPYSTPNVVGGYPNDPHYVAGDVVRATVYKQCEMSDLTDTKNISSH